MVTENALLLVARISFVLLWSSGFIASNIALNYAGPYTTLFLRYTLLSLVLLSAIVFLCPRRKIAWATVRQFALIGLLAHALYLSTQWVAYVLGATAGMAALIGALQPLLTGLLCYRSLGETNTPRQWMGLTIGFCAVILIVANQMLIGGSVLALILLLTSLACITLASLHQRWLDRFRTGSQPSLLVNLTIQCTASALALWAPAWFLEANVLSWSWSFGAALLWLSIVSLGGYGTFWFLVKHCPATQVASLVYFTVPATMFMSYLAFGDEFSQLDFLGLLLAAVGVRLARQIELPAGSQRQTDYPAR